MNRSSWYVTAGIATLAGLLPLLATGCHKTSAEAAHKDKESAVQEVTVAHPTRQTLTRLVQQPGFNRPYEQTLIYSKIAGFVEKWNVDIGDHVKKGQQLVKLWVPEVEQALKAKEARAQQTRAELVQAEEGLKAAEANVQTAEATVREAEAGVAQVQAEYKRWDAEYVRANQLLAKNIYDKQTRDEALHQLQATGANLEKARAKVASMKAAQIESVAKRNKAKADVSAVQARVQVADADVKEQAAWLNYADIRAPYDGVVTQRNIVTGDFVQPASSGSTNRTAEPLYVVTRMDIMRVTVQVPEYDAVLIKDGDPATVIFQALKGREFHGQVTRGTWSLDPQARTLRVEIHLRNTPTEELRPQMYANATIQVKLPSVWTLPAEAVLEDGEKHYVFTVRDGKAFRLPIQIGVRAKQRVQVLRKQGKEENWEDFTGAEPIVVSNPGSLLEGQPVAPRQ